MVLHLVWKGWVLGEEHLHHKEEPASSSHISCMMLFMPGMTAYFGQIELGLASKNSPKPRASLFFAVIVFRKFAEFHYRQQRSNLYLLLFTVFVKFTILTICKN